MKNIKVFNLENFKVLEEKFSIYLNRRVFVMVLSRMSLTHECLNTCNKLFHQKTLKCLLCVQCVLYRYSV